MNQSKHLQIILFVPTRLKKQKNPKTKQLKKHTDGEAVMSLRGKPPNFSLATFTFETVMY